jgi:hypothetical protein
MELPDLLAKITLAQQIGVAILRALGMQGDEVGAIAACAAETGIRLGRKSVPF